MKRLSDLFDVRYGNQFDFSKMIPSDKDNAINFIGRDSNNNGYVGKVERLNDIEPFSAGLITVSLGGTYLLSSFVQPLPFYTAQNIKVLTPKQEMSLSEKLFYCAAIQHNRFRYRTHAREANATLNDLLVPDINEIPDYVIKEIVSIQSKHEDSLQLTDTQHWKWFYFDEIFEIKNGFYNKKPEKDGDKIRDIPFIGAIADNNGVADFYSIEEIKQCSRTGQLPNQDISKKIFNGNCISISNNGSVGYAFYQEHKFTCSHDVTPLYLKNHTLNKYIAMFICTLIELERYRWTFGRKWRPIRMPKSRIKLPVTDDGSPDWQYMEDYIKSLPYGDCI